MKILLVEDDEKVGSFLKEHLGKENYQVHLLVNADELDHFLVERPFIPDLIIIDRLLGNHDTKNDLKKIKARFKESRIMYLSALNIPAEKAALLDEGADDYMGKPFSLVEVQARVRALLRRKDDNQMGQYINVLDLIVDLRSRGVNCKGKKVELTNKEFSLLVNFAQNANKVFSKFQLLDIIWETNLDVESNVLEVTVMNLRKKLDEVQSEFKIHSKRNVGYWLET